MNKQKIISPNEGREPESINKSFLGVFITTFTTVFIAELGDKTQIATLLLTAQSNMPLIVFLGAASALICTSLIGVILGRWLAKIMPAERLEYAAGLLMVGIGLYLSLQASQNLLENLA